MMQKLNSLKIIPIRNANRRIFFLGNRIPFSGTELDDVKIAAIVSGK
jgi:hypothetical protein